MEEGSFHYLQQKTPKWERRVRQCHWHFKKGTSKAAPPLSFPAVPGSSGPSYFSHIKGYATQDSFLGSWRLCLSTLSPNPQTKVQGPSRSTTCLKKPLNLWSEVCIRFSVEFKTLYSLLQAYFLSSLLTIRPPYLICLSSPHPPTNIPTQLLPGEALPRLSS